MNTKARIIATICCAFLVLLLLGFWVGAFEIFGGYVARKRIFLLASATIGMFGALLIYRRWKVHYALAGAFFFCRIACMSWAGHLERLIMWPRQTREALRAHWFMHSTTSYEEAA